MTFLEVKKLSFLIFKLQDKKRKNWLRYLASKVFFKYVDSESDEEIVIQQSDAPLTSVDETQIITLNLSKKLTRHTVPDFKGLSVQEAKELAQLLSIKVFVKHTSNQMEGKIISQSHDQNLLISEDTVRTLEIDPESIMVQVPDFYNMNRIDAEVLADNLGLKVTIKEHNGTTKPNNTVIGQNMKAKNRVAKGTVIIRCHYQPRRKGAGSNHLL